VEPSTVAQVGVAQQVFFARQLCSKKGQLCSKKGHTQVVSLATAG